MLGPNSSSTPRSDEAHSPALAMTPSTDMVSSVSSRSQPRVIPRPHEPLWVGELPHPKWSSAPGAAVNMNHMAFLLHFKFSVAIPELDSEFDSMATTWTNKLALQFPWLLNAMLAISARHLAILRPDRSSLYLSEAFQIQNQAITIFNSEQMSIDETNCSAALLFSSILGRHMLVDTLAGLDSDGSVLLDNYCSYVQIHRGLRVITSDSWQLLSESEIWPFLLFAGVQMHRKGRGTELQDLRSWIQESQGLDEECLEACLSAVDMLQVGLDEVSTAKTNIRRYQMAFIWSICNKAKFNDLVMQRVPQALVILAHYAALLHHAKGPNYENQLWWTDELRGYGYYGSMDESSNNRLNVEETVSIYS
ncbi:hypothetical protein ONZ43_g6352 [Nemania bipapillata]|uniref:Uncharacterized protein n=1 Tax=Nemania bipapillata TaxID=110536 RepID=A0ACC2I0Z4_9PEZI|nr:hypothetical protein ONZ43_g6352 [Nemania bipapillata]